MRTTNIISIRTSILLRRALGIATSTSTNGWSTRTPTTQTSIIAMSIEQTLVKIAGCLLMMGSAHAGTLHLVQTIPLGGVEGRIDHMAIDIKGQRLFVAALGNNSVEVLDLRAGKRVRSLTDFREPQGVAWIAKPGQLLVASGG